MTAQDPNLRPDPLVNTLGRPPRRLDISNPKVRGLLMEPGLTHKLQLLIEEGRISEADARELITDIRQFRRAENGDRKLPGEYNGNPRLPTEPLPFAPLDDHRPDRQPGSDAHRVYKAAVDQIDAGTILDGLKAKMGTDANPPEASTWERADPNYREPAPASDLDANPPSLREQVTAAATVHGLNRE